METLPAANARLTWTPRRVGLALAASLGVHGVLVAALLLAGQSPTRDDHAGTTEVALRYAIAASAAAGNPGAHRHHVVSTDAPATATTALISSSPPATMASTPANGADAATPVPVATSSSAPTTATDHAASAQPAPTASADALRRDYLLRLGQRLAQELRYPPDARARGAEGRAQVHLHIARDGRVLSAVVTRGSGDSALDAGALDTVRRENPLPPFPPGLPDAALDVELPLSFRLDARTLP